jgi:hypothetical protein
MKINFGKLYFDKMFSFSQFNVRFNKTLKDTKPILINVQKARCKNWFNKKRYKRKLELVKVLFQQIESSF